MPDLVTTDGETLAPSLTADELAVLEEYDVPFDLDGTDESGGADSGEAHPDASGSDSADVEMDSDPADSGADSAESDVGDGSESDSDGERTDSTPDSDATPGESDGPTDTDGPDMDGMSEPDRDGEADPDAESASDTETADAPADDPAGDPEGEADGSGTGGDAGADSPDSSAEAEANLDDSADSAHPDSGVGEERPTEDVDRPEEVSGEVDEVTHTIEPDEDVAEEMDGRDESDMAEKFDVDVDEIHRADERDIERWHQLVKNLSAYDTDITRRKRERDKRIDRGVAKTPSDELRKRAEQSGAIEELKQGLRDLVTRPAPQPDTVGPQIDPYNVTRRAAGDRTVRELFEEYVQTETGDRCVGLATDISGSMRGDIEELKIAGGVFAEATEIIGDQFVWEAFTDQYSDTHTPTEERLDLRIVTAPDEQFQWGHVDSFRAKNNEPTAAAIRDCRMLMEQTETREYVMIVITDGATLIEEDGTHYRSRDSSGRGAPIDQTRRAVRECRQAGFDVIGLGIGGMDDEKMAEQFGEDERGNANYKLTSIDDLAEDVLEIYRRMMDVKR